MSKLSAVGKFEALSPPLLLGGVGGTVDNKSALISTGIFLSRVLAAPLVPWPDGGPESLRSPYCGLALHRKPNLGL
ncbi:hypothetical protein PoB_004503800 [Plakobranchus ocellatus]|uniref:Uncharacterized protein n=1 Tax=Plakobranchus ocellatus TaxID=259542 RepID=A0AAV4BG09_9GAST|nr:hypothetical protein PoB_004503800 [Plakobranchus ocellatus]